MVDRNKKADIQVEGKLQNGNMVLWSSKYWWRLCEFKANWHCEWWSQTGSACIASAGDHGGKPVEIWADAIFYGRIRSRNKK